VSELLETKQMQSYSYDEAHCGYGNANEVELSFRGNGFDGASFELFHSRQNQMFGNTRISSRGFTWSDNSGSTNIHTADFAGMDTSGVIATGSWSGPRIDFTTIVSDDGHAVPSFDINDISPADRVFLDGVRNGYAFIEDCNFGTIDHQVDDTAKTRRPDDRNDTAPHVAAQPSLNIQSEYQHKNKTGTESARFGSEDFGVAHPHFIDHEVIVAYYGGDFRG
jgi:hypothetical protein